MKWLRKGAYNTVKELVQANTGMSAMILRMMHVVIITQESKRQQTYSWTTSNTDQRFWYGVTMTQMELTANSS